MRKAISNTSLASPWCGMHNDRSAILSLASLGRITQREAERLLAVWRDGDETILLVALCLAFAALVLPYVGNAVTAYGQALATLLPAIERALLLMGGMAGRDIAAEFFPKGVKQVWATRIGSLQIF